ncbi:tyrosine-type recombinase/integrase [Legionella rowbothamii]|uniref:tyrosine-type recombinase/integrase n=1 Tax=Legionella rowbothamii TaxID=96229 RepID=UPI001F5EA639|nr:tyrosine-type recombinase/integrase [Legionella rowbothamii]
MTERKAPITTDTFRKIIARAGDKAELRLAIHPHMLRHSTGFKLANDGWDTRSIQHTIRYTEIASVKFKEFWDD